MLEPSQCCPRRPHMSSVCRDGARNILRCAMTTHVSLAEDILDPVKSFTSPFLGACLRRETLLAQWTARQTSNLEVVGSSPT